MSSYLYAYLVPDLNAVKIGRGDDPAARMRDYCYQYGIKPDGTSLITWRLPANANPDTYEKACHVWAMGNGISRITMNGSRELFQLGDTPAHDFMFSLGQWFKAQQHMLMHQAFPEVKAEMDKAHAMFADAKRQVASAQKAATTIEAEAHKRAKAVAAQSARDHKEAHTSKWFFAMFMAAAVFAGLALALIDKATPETIIKTVTERVEVPVERIMIKEIEVCQEPEWSKSEYTLDPDWFFPSNPTPDGTPRWVHRSGGSHDNMPKTIAEWQEYERQQRAMDEADNRIKDIWKANQ